MALFESYHNTYEAGPAEYDDFPQTEEPVWVLGKAYSALYDLQELMRDVRSKIWFSYRKNFSPVGNTGPSSDTGWGCMLRCGQMMLAQALVMRHLGREWHWDQKTPHSVYQKILKMFEDRKSACYSIHQIAQMGVSEGKAVGQWFGPNTVAQVLRKLCVYDEWSRIKIHVAMDNTVIIDDIVKLCTIENRTEGGTTAVSGDGSNVVQNRWSKEDSALFNGTADDSSVGRPLATGWSPLVLFIPLRLGLDTINPLYTRSLKTCFMLKQSLGIIGGKPNHAYYFIGYVDDQLIYLDPHTTQPTVLLDGSCGRSSESVVSADDSYHCMHASRMSIMNLDPSVALGFYCHTQADFTNLCRDLHKLVIEPDKQPMFEIYKHRPPHWPKTDANEEASANEPPVAGVEFTVVEDRKYDTDEEFELL